MIVNKEKEEQKQNRPKPPRISPRDAGNPLVDRMPLGLRDKPPVRGPSSRIKV